MMSTSGVAPLLRAGVWEGSRVPDGRDGSVSSETVPLLWVMTLMPSVDPAPSLFGASALPSGGCHVLRGSWDPTPSRVKFTEFSCAAPGAGAIEYTGVVRGWVRLSRVHRCACLHVPYIYVCVFARMQTRPCACKCVCVLYKLIGTLLGAQVGYVRALLWRRLGHGHVCMLP